MLPIDTTAPGGAGGGAGFTPLVAEGCTWLLASRAKLVTTGVPATDVRVRAPVRSETNPKVTPLLVDDDVPELKLDGSARRWTCVFSPAELSKNVCTPPVTLT